MAIRARRSQGVVSIVPPCRVVKVNHKIAVVRDDSIIEGQPTDVTPMVEGTPLRDWSTPGGALIGHLDLEGKSAPWLSVTFVKNLRHYFVTKVQSPSFNSWLFRRNHETHKLRASRGFTL